MSAKEAHAMDRTDWKDISSEEWRMYEFPHGILTIKSPTRLLVCESSKGGDSHRVIDSDGLSYYVPSGWLAIKWKPREGSPAVSF